MANVKYLSYDGLQYLVNKIKIHAIAERITYNDLVTKRNNGELQFGKYYMITDYVTIVNNTGQYISIGEGFAIIVLATSERTLSEEAFAYDNSDEEGYFRVNNANLNAWKLWYCLDNDTNRFEWASGDGKGVIYRMIDEHGNDCPYDFKNIKFKRFELAPPVTSSSEPWLEQLSSNITYQFSNNSLSYIWAGTHNDNNHLWEEDHGEVYSTTTGNTKFFFTFSHIISIDTDNIKDLSIIGNNCKNNVIKEYYVKKLQLNDIVFFNTTSNSSCCANIFDDNCIYNSLGDSCYSNSFGNHCARNTFGINCRFNSFNSYCNYISAGNGYVDNSFGNFCSSNSFNNNCEYNSFGNFCSINSFGSNCSGNRFANGCESNRFLNSSSNNNFGNTCNSNIIGNSCSNNSFGDGCGSNRLVGGCYYNSFSSSCKSNIFANKCSYNSFGDGCTSNNFADSCSYNSFGNGCNSNRLSTNSCNNSFGNTCVSNRFGAESYNNSCGNNCKYISLYSYCYSNSFGNECTSVSLADHCSNNSFGNICGRTTLGMYCMNNSFGNQCHSNLFGDYFCFNRFGNGCTFNSFRVGNSTSTSLRSYCYYNYFDDGCSYNVIWNDASANINNILQNIHIKHGVIGNSLNANIINIQSLNNEYCTTVAKTSTNELLIYCEEDCLTNDEIDTIF